MKTSRRTFIKQGTLAALGSTMLTNAFPLGMTQKKKLSDFFIDQKMDRFQKEKIWVLESLGKIIWLVGHRIDNRYKITDATKKVLQLTLQ
jgi:tRNA(Ile)-lysidine synthase